jgi:hypothetical protein
MHAKKTEIAYRESVIQEIVALQARIAAIAKTVASLRSQHHETADAYKELEFLRGRLEVLERIVPRKGRFHS